MMRHLLTGMVVAIGFAIIGPVWAQAPYPGTYQPQSPAAAYPDPSRYRFVAPTPRDAYRLGLINRWELEQLEGPTPQALQGPSPDGGFAGRGAGN
jgi:hypothetical protein